MVVAHGMGARLVIEAVGGEAEPPMAAVAPPRRLRFIFVAPDVRSDTFKQRLARFPAGTLRTMYCNSNDQARSGSSAGALVTAPAARVHQAAVSMRVHCDALPTMFLSWVL